MTAGFMRVTMEDVVLASVLKFLSVEPGVACLDGFQSMLTKIMFAPAVLCSNDPVPCSVAAADAEDDIAAQTEAETREQQLLSMKCLIAMAPGKQASRRASRWAGLATDKQASGWASRWAGLATDMQASGRASRWAGLATDKQASGRASRWAGLAAGKQASERTSRWAGLAADKQASERASRWAGEEGNYYKTSKTPSQFVWGITRLGTPGVRFPRVRYQITRLGTPGVRYPRVMYPRG